MWPRPSRDPVSLPSSAGIRARPKPLWPPWRVAGGGWHPAQGQPLRPAARSRDGGRVLRLQGRLQLHSCLLPAVWGPGLGTGQWVVQEGPPRQGTVSTSLPGPSQLPGEATAQREHLKQAVHAKALAEAAPVRGSEAPCVARGRAVGRGQTTKVPTGHWRPPGRADATQTDSTHSKILGLVGGIKSSTTMHVE